MSAQKDDGKRSSRGGNKWLCATCGEEGHRYDACTRIRNVRLPKLECLACGRHRAARVVHVTTWASQRIYRSIGASLTSDEVPYPHNDPTSETVRLLREHGFDKRAALASVATFTDETGTYFSGAFWEMTRRELRFSDWPSDASWYFDRIDPTDEDARLAAWGGADPRVRWNTPATAARRVRAAPIQLSLFAEAP